TIERCIIMSDTDIIDVDDLPFHIRSADGKSTVNLSGPLFSDESEIIPFDKLKEEAIKHALRVTNGNIVEASKKLQIGRATFYRFMEKFNIIADEF
ncbi:MAG: helix-turn-helix domain-containing protein, partial [Syntrophothermus sp.]